MCQLMSENAKHFSLYYIVFTLHKQETQHHKICSIQTVCDGKVFLWAPEIQKELGTEIPRQNLAQT
jgi:hypothetical protein